MTRPRSYDTDAIIIKKAKSGEADRILTLYTPNLGKIRGLAKGIRRPRAKLAGHLELLTHSHITLVHGKAVDTIIGSQTIDSFLPLKSDLKLTSYALYAVELTEQFTADNVEDESLFRLLLDTLKLLCQEPGLNMLIRYYELRLLGEAGYRPQLHDCVLCHKPLEPVTNYFLAAAGGGVCPACARGQLYARALSVNALKVLRLCQNSEYSVVKRVKIDAELAHELDEVLRGYIRYLLEKDLKSAEWLTS